MSRARDLADVWNATAGLVDITSSFTRNAGWTKSGTERVLHDPLKDLVYYQLGLYMDSTSPGADALGNGDWLTPSDNTILYTIASGYRPIEQGVTTNITGVYDSGTIAFDTNGDVRLDYAQNWEGARFRVYINGWYRI